jgi:uncharacterized membrane protein YesL
MTIFSYESRFSKVMMRIAHGCYLNLLWAVCSLPIVTLGAATTALYDVTLRMARNEEGDITSQFFRAFRSNFKQATQLWLVVLLAATVLGTDIYVLGHLRDVTTGTMAIVLTLALAMVIAACVALGIVAMYVFPLTARVENTNVNMLKNSLLIGTHFLFCTICVFAIHAAMAIAIIAIFTPLMVMGEGLCAVISSYLLYPVIMGSAHDPRRDLPEGEGGAGKEALR